MNNKNPRKPVRWWALIFLALVIPVFVRNPYYLHVFIMIFLHVILATSLYLTFTTRQISAAHAAFMGLGGYTSAILTMRLGFPFWAALPLAGLLPAGVALLVGYPSLRIKGVYFIIVTFSFGEIMRLVWVQWRSLFGGPSGISGIASPEPIHLPGIPPLTFGSKTSMYYLVFVVACLSVMTFSKILRSRGGLTFKAIGQADVLCQSVGVNIMIYKMLAFAIGCFFAGIAGALYAHYIHTISPYDFTFSLSVTAIIYVVVGGMGRLEGPIVGAVVLTVLSEVLLSVGTHDELGLGIVLVLVMLFIRGGLVGLPGEVARWTRKLRGDKGWLYSKSKA